MARLATVILLSLLLIGLGAGLAASAGAIPIIKDVQPTPLRVFTDLGDGRATGVAAAPSGVGYVCGYGLDLLHEDDLLIARVGPGAWAAHYDGSAHGVDRAWDVVYASAGAVYVAGASQRLDDTNAAVLLKYSPAGKRLWVRRWNGPADANPSAKKLLIDGQGRIVVVGQAFVEGHPHIYAAKYTPGGRLLWTRVYRGGYIALFRDAVLDGAGNLYVVGQWSAASGGTYDGLVVRVSTAGKIQWVKKWDAVGLYDSFFAVCRRPAGGVFIAGQSETGGDDYDGLLVRYSATGAVKVVKRSGTADGAYTAFYDVVRASDGRLVVCGGYSEGSGPSSFVVASYSENGTENWYRSYPSASGSSRAEILVARADGAVAASGFWARQSGTGPQDVMTYFMNRSGVRRARNQWPGPAPGETWPLDMSARGASVWVAGVCYGNGSGADAYAMRLVP